MTQQPTTQQTQTTNDNILNENKNDNEKENNNTNNNEKSNDVTNTESKNKSEIENDSKSEESKNENENLPKITSSEILDIRENLEKIKKGMNAVMPTVDQIVRFKDAGKNKSAKKWSKKRDKQLSDFKTLLSSLDISSKEYNEGLKLSQILGGDLTRGELGNLNFRIRSWTQSLTKKRNELLQLYKKVKKQEEQG